MKLNGSIYCKFLDGECFEHGVKCDNCLEKNLEDSLLDPDKWEGKVDEEDQSPEFRNKGKQKDFCLNYTSECFKDGEKCHKCEYRDILISMKLFRVHYEASLIVSMPEPCGVMKEAICKGDILIEVQSAEAAEAAVESMIENYFCIDDIISINAEEEPIPPDEFPCEECEFNSNGTCVLII